MNKEDREAKKMNKIVTNISINFFYIIFVISFILSKFIVSFIKDRSLIDSFKRLPEIKDTSIQEAKELFNKTFGGKDGKN